MPELHIIRARIENRLKTNDNSPKLKFSRPLAAIHKTYYKNIKLI